MPIEELVTRVDAALARLDTLDNAIPGVEEHAHAIRAQLDYLQGAFAAADSVIAPTAVRIDLATDMTNAEVALVDFQGVPNLDHLQAARVALEHAVERSTSLPFVAGDAGVIQRAAARLRDGVRTEIARVEEMREAAELRERELAERVDTLDASLTAASSAIETRLAAALEPISAKADQLESALSTQEERIGRLATSQTDQYTQAEERRLRQYTEVIEKLQTDNAAELKKQSDLADETFRGINERAEQNMTDLATSTTESIEGIRRREEEAGSLVASASRKAVSGGFLEDAKQHALRATILQVIAGLLLAGVVVFGWYVLEVQQIAVTSLEFILGRVLIALPAVGFAVYLLREAGKHRDAAAEAKSLHLDHQAFGPYTELMEGKEDLRVKMADRAFFRERGGASGESTPGGDLTKDLIATIQKALDVIGKR